MAYCHELGEYSVEFTAKYFLQFQLTEQDVIWSKLPNQNKGLAKQQTNPGIK